MANPVYAKPFQIRQANIHDVSALASLHVTTFNETHGNSPGYELRKRQWQDIFQNKDDSWFCFLVEDDKKNLVGFAKGQPYDHADLPEFAGELNKIYILRKCQKLGLGHKLLCKVAQEFHRRGIHSFLLFGDANNPSNGFYELMGGEKLFTKEGDFHGGYGWKELGPLLSVCKSD